MFIHLIKKQKQKEREQTSMENTIKENLINNNNSINEYICVLEPNNLVYQDDNHKINISYTTNLNSHLSRYNTATPDGITVHGTFRIYNANKIEKHLHNKYVSKATTGNNNDWFNLTQSDLADILNYLSIVENADNIRLGISTNSVS